MTWIRATPNGFGGAIAVFANDTYLLALWAHEHCQGWQLYLGLSSPYPFTRTRWLVGAGVESLGWTDEQAMAWGETQIERISQQSPPSQSV